MDKCFSNQKAQFYNWRTKRPGPISEGAQIAGAQVVNAIIVSHKMTTLEALGPQRSHNGPTWLEIAHENPRVAQKGPKRVPRGAQSDKDGAKMGPRWSQDGLKWAQDEAKMGPTWAKMKPRWGQDGAKMAPRWAKRGHLEQP